MSVPNISVFSQVMVITAIVQNQPHVLLSKFVALLNYLLECTRLRTERDSAKEVAMTK